MAAEVGGGGGSRKKGKKQRGKKHSTRIDMTPMVDVAFLLLTFFVLTTTLSTPQAMPLVLPAKEDPNEEQVEPPKVKWDKVVHLLLGPNDKVYYYQYNPEDEATNINLEQTNYDPQRGIRKKIMDFRQVVEAAYGEDEMVILIKQSRESTFKNLIDILDEMAITDQQRFALADISEVEEELIQEYGSSQGQ